MNSVAPVWDGNETWLVLGGGGLLAAFPLAYAIIMPAVYAPLIAMLLGLVFRGVAFEFRWRTTRQPIWDFAFFAGSVVAAFAQGVTLGAILQGVSVTGPQLFGPVVGMAVAVQPAVPACRWLSAMHLLGACWLIFRTENRSAGAGLCAGALARHRHVGRGAGGQPGDAVHLDGDYYKRWFYARTCMVLLSPIPVLASAGAALGFFRSLLGRRAELAPFLFALALFLLSFIGLGVSMFPYLIPGQLTIWQAAAPGQEPDAFMLVGAGIMVPIILDLYRLCLLGFPRQGRPRRVSLGCGRGGWRGSSDCGRRALRRSPRSAS